jgi:hypothetical protein
MKWLLRLYPTRWRRRYGDEFSALLENQPLTLKVALDILIGALDAWLRPQVDSNAQMVPAGRAQPPRQKDRFDEFTQRSRNALRFASEEARLMRHDFISTEHLLLGLLHDQDSVAMRVLKRLDVDPARVRSEIHAAAALTSANEQPTHGLTPSAKRVIELTVQEAARSRCDYVGTEHLLLGLMSEREGLAAAVLANLTGADLAVVRSAVLHVLNADIRGAPWRRGPGSL